MEKKEVGGLFPPENCMGMSAGPDAATAAVCPTKPNVKGSLSIFRVLLEQDTQFSLWIHRLESRVPRSLLQALEYSGDGLFWIPATAAICFAPVFTAQQFFSNLLVGFLFDLLFVGLIKGLIRRPRPVYNRGMYLVLSVDHYSFPSGHSSRAFLILVFFMEHSSLWKGLILSFLRPSVEGLDSYDMTPDLETLVYYPIAFSVLLWAVATASSRILLGRHYLLDVVAGSSLGVLEALFVLEILIPRQILFGNFLHRLMKG